MLRPLYSIKADRMCKNVHSFLLLFLLMNVLSLIEKTSEVTVHMYTGTETGSEVVQVLTRVRAS